MQTKFAPALVAAFAALTLTTYAATPVAVWDGDFSAVQTGYTLNLNGNTLGDGNSSVTIDQAVGVTVTSDSTFASGFTVLVEYSGLDTSLHAKQVLATSTLTDAANRTGATIDAAGKSCGIWAGASWNSSGTYNSMTSSQSSGILVFSHYSTTSYSGTGTQLYYIAPDTLAGTTILNAGTLGSDNDKSKYKGFSIGGSSAAIDGFSAATGMKISKIAVFSGVPGLKSIQAYCAGTKNLQVSADKTFSEILDDAGITSTLAPYTSLEITAVNTPTITFDVAGAELYALTVNGSAVFDMESSLYENGSFSKKLLTVGDSISAPDATYNVNADWKGAFVQSSDSITLYAQNAETISINIGGGTGTADTSDDANLVSGSDYYGLYPTPGSAWNNISGRWQSSKTVTLTSAKAFDGETTTTRNTIQLSGTSGNTWQWTGTSVPFLRGYLDDTAGIQVQIVGVPYSQYDVIIYATSDSDLALNYFTINGTGYTCSSDGIATEGTSSWGVGQTTTPTLGKNAMLVQGVTGSTLTISGTRAASAPRVRVTVCAVQIINKGVVESSDWSANLDATTTFAGGTGAGLSGQSGAWANSALASITITNKASAATLTLDGEITAGSLKIVGDEGKRLTVAKDPGATLDIAIYDLTESEEEATFLFDPDFSKVNAGSNLIGVGFNYEGTIASGRHYTGSENVLTLATVSGGEVNVGGAGTISGNLDISDDATVVFDGDYTSSGDTMLGATKGVLNIANGASVSVPHVRLVNSSSSVACTMNVNGALTVTSTSSGSNVYSERNSYKGILFGHYYGSSTVNVGSTGSIIGTAAWMQLTYTAPNTMTVDGGTVKVRGINGGTYSGDNSPLTLTGGGVIEVAEGFVNMGYITRNYGYGTIKTYSYNSSTGWTDPGAITFTDTANGTTIDPCGMADMFSGALSGAGKIVVRDSVGGGSVSFTGASNNLTGDIVVDSGATLNLGLTRPTGTLTVNGVVSVTLATKADVPVLKVSAEPVANSIKLYDIDGETEIEANVSYDSVAGTVTVKPPVNTWTVSSDYSFDTAANWTRGLPAQGQDIAINVSGDAVLTVSDTYSAATLTISGQGVVELAGSGAITVETLYLAGGATFAPNSTVAAESIVLNSGTVLRVKDKTEEAVISGAGAVETYGNVVLAAGNKLTGGIIVKAGSALSTSAEPVWENPSTKAVCASGYGPYNKDWAYSAQSRVTVEDGGCVDINNVANKDVGVALTIAGKGILLAGGYSGAVVYTGSSAIGNNSRQISSLTLTADALVDIGMGCGLVHSGHNPACLALNGHTLTVSGSGTVPMVNVNASNSTGMLVLDGANLQLISAACNFTGVDIVAKGCSAIDFAIAPSAIGSLTLKPSASGTTASNWNLPTSCVPVVNTSNVDVSGLADGNAVVLFTDTHESLEYGSNIVWQVGGRFTGGNDAHEVTATYAAGTPQPLLHYDFNNGAAVDTGKASDSKYQISSVGEASSVTLVNSRNGKAVQVHTDYTPYWGGTSFGNSPVHAGEVTVTTVAKLKELGIILWGLGNANDSNTAFGLVAPTANSASVILRNPDGTVATLATIEGTGDLTKGWHFFAVVADANGTTFYVDDLKAASSVPAAAAVGQQGQLGSFHGGAPTGYNKAGTNGDGYYLDDWRVYDAALTTKEIRSLKSALLPDPFIIRFR